MAPGTRHDMNQEPSIDTLMNIGWYLGTSLFMDFIERNIRRGFDSAEEHDGHTILLVKCSSQRVQAFVPVIAGSKRFAFELTRNVDQLRNIQLSHRTQFYYSEMTKAECLRALRKAHVQRQNADILDWWQAFCFLLRDYRRVELDFQIDEELSTLALNFPVRKNVQDYLNLIISKKKGLAFITSDKLDGQIEELQKDYYSHIYYWPEIKDKVPLDEVFKQLPR